MGIESTWEVVRLEAILGADSHGIEASARSCKVMTLFFLGERRGEHDRLGISREPFVLPLKNIFYIYSHKPAFKAILYLKLKETPGYKNKINFIGCQ